MRKMASRVYNRNRSFILLLTVLLLFANSSCVATPKENYVDNKLVNNTEETVDKASNSDTTQETAYQYPAQWNTTFSKGNVAFTVDASVVVPDDFKEEGQYVTWVQVQPYDVDMIQKLIDTHLPGQKIDGYASVMENKQTKSEIAELLLQDKESLAQLKSDPAKWFYPDTYTDAQLQAAIAQYEQDIEDLTAAYDSAPEQVTQHLYTLDEILHSSLLFSIISGDKTIGGLMISSADCNDGKAMQITFMFSAISSVTPSEETFDEDRAMQTAKDFAEEIGWSSYEPEIIEQATALGEPYYRIVLVKTYYGLPETYIGGHDLSSSLTEDQYAAKWNPESIVLYVTADGVRRADWCAPTAVSSVDSTNCRLCDFQKIQDRFLSYIQMREGWIDEDSGIVSKRIEITRIRLGVMKVKTTSGEYQMIPVWDFQGSVIDKYKEQQEGGYILDENMEYTEPGIQTLVTINALTGVVIDRAVGY